MHTITQYPILVVASSCDLYNCDLFLFTQTLTVHKLELFCTGVKVPTTSSVLLFFCVENEIQEDLGVGEVGLRSVLGLAARSGGCAKSWFC